MEIEFGLIDLGWKIDTNKVLDVCMRECVCMEGRVVRAKGY